MCGKEEVCIFFEEDEEIDLEAVVTAILKDVEHFDEHFLACPWLYDLQFLLVGLLGEEEAKERVPMLFKKSVRKAGDTIG